MKDWLREIDKNEIESLLYKGKKAKILFNLSAELDERVVAKIKSMEKQMINKPVNSNFSTSKIFKFATAASIIIIFAALFFYYQSTKKPSGMITTFDTAVVTFVVGDVYVDKNTNWENIEAGDIVSQNESIKVEKDSYCELQFGDSSVVKISENTNITLKSVIRTTDYTDIRIELLMGTIYCKVDKLTGEEFKILTGTAICGVRGTQFRVNYSEYSGTELIVYEGKVAVSPPIDIIEKNKQLIVKDLKYRESLASLEKDSTIIGAENSVIIGVALVKTVKNDLIALSDNINKIESATTEANEDFIGLNIIISNIKAKYKIEASKPINKDSSEYNEDINTFQKLCINNEAKDFSNSSSHKPDDDAKKTLSSILLQTVPRDTEIYLNGEFLGRGKFSGLFKNGEVLSFTFRRKGYKNEALKVEVSSSHENKYSIQLLLAPDTEEETDSNPKAIETISDKEETITKKTSEEFTSTTSVGPVEKILQISGLPIIGNIAYSGSTFVAVDNSGKLTAFNKTGDKMWSFITKNNPNENSFPVIIKDKVVFSGTEELIILNLNNGAVIKKISLDSESSHIFGQRVVRYNDYGVLSSNNSIRVLDLASGNIVKEFEVPGGTRMTPMIYNNFAYIVNQNGTIYIYDLSDYSASPVSLSSKATQPIATSLTLFGNYAYFAGRKGMVVCVDLVHNKIVWQKELSPGNSVQVLHDIECNSGGAFIFANKSIYSLNLTNGNQLFAPVTDVSGPPVIYNGKLYFGTLNNELMVVDSSTGKMIKSLSLDSRITSRPVIIKNKIYIGTAKGEVIILNDDNIY